MAKQDITLAYRPQEFMDLGVTIAQWAASKEIYASFPTIIEKEGRWYYSFSFGHCPESSGQPALAAWDDLNDCYLYWDQGEAEETEGMEFHSLLALTAYVERGELPI